MFCAKTGYVDRRTQRVKPDNRLQSEAWIMDAAPVAVLIDGWGPVVDAAAVASALLVSAAVSVAVAAVE